MPWAIDLQHATICGIWVSDLKTQLLVVSLQGLAAGDANGAEAAATAAARSRVEALAAMRLPEAYREGLESCYWPGRAEVPALTTCPLPTPCLTSFWHVLMFPDGEVRRLLLFRTAHPGSELLTGRKGAMDVLAIGSFSKERTDDGV